MTLDGKRCTATEHVTRQQCQEVLPTLSFLVGLGQCLGEGPTHLPDLQGLNPMPKRYRGMWDSTTACSPSPCHTQTSYLGYGFSI